MGDDRMTYEDLIERWRKAKLRIGALDVELLKMSEACEVEREILKDALEKIANYKERKKFYKELEKIEVGQYNNPEETGGYSGWINPEREDGQSVPAWMLFIKTDGTVQLCIRNVKGELDLQPPGSEKPSYLSDAAHGFLEGRNFDTLIVDPHKSSERSEVYIPLKSDDASAS